MKSRGVTLVEVLIGGMIAGMVFGAGFGLLRESMDVANQGNVVLGNIQGASLLMDRIEADLERAYSVETPASGGAARSSQLVFNAVDGFKGGTLEVSRVSYNLVSNGVIRQVERATGEAEFRAFCVDLKVGFEAWQVARKGASGSGPGAGENGGAEGLWVRISAENPVPPGQNPPSGGKDPFVLSRCFKIPGTDMGQGGWVLPLPKDGSGGKKTED